ncbi:unnamed protein product [Vicia faba]|uniref:Uncharacterized protein n=1 Tax=Vicia faba TaxID=3906 RepID=A0AAV0ZH63_VICFA|nr:unnamed protein product [Vicia faba]
MNPYAFCPGSINSFKIPLNLPYTTSFIGSPMIILTQIRWIIFLFRKEVGCAIIVMVILLIISLHHIFPLIFMNVNLISFSGLIDIICLVLVVPNGNLGVNPFSSWGIILHRMKSAHTSILLEGLIIFSVQTYFSLINKTVVLINLIGMFENFSLVLVIPISSPIMKLFYHLGHCSASKE